MECSPVSPIIGEDFVLYVGVAIVEVELLIFLKKVVEVIGELSDSSYQFKLVG